MQSDILKPVAVLVAWTLIVLVFLIVKRLPALKRAGIDINKVRGSKPGQLDQVLDEKAQWPAHNYMHLVEQPTLFYAVAISIAMLGHGNGVNATIAWLYVGLRIVHSLIQVTSNIIRYRFLVFAASTLALVSLTVHLVYYAFGLHGEPIFPVG